MATHPIPAGYRTVTPFLYIRDAAKAIAFYAKAFGAVEMARLEDPSGKIAHARLRSATPPIMISDEFAEWGNLGPQSRGGATSSLHLYVDDVDAVFERAVAAGATVLIPVADRFYGDRAGRLLDPFGHIWIIGSRIEEVPLVEMRRRFDGMRRENEA